LAGHFLLTEMLLERMIETAANTGIQGRIINVTSMIHSWVKRDAFSFNQMLHPKKYNFSFFSSPNIFFLKKNENPWYLGFSSNHPSDH
jgi:hypothetical protein